MGRVQSRALPIAVIDTQANEEAGNIGIGPVVSSAHLAAGRSPALSEVEYGLMIATSAFNRWMVRCMAASGQPGLSSTEVAILHSVAHRGREKRMADIALVLDIEDIHVVSYAVKKLEAAGLIKTRRAGKEKMVEISDAGFEVCRRYGQLREKLLLDIASQARIPESELSHLGSLLRMLSGTYNQAARAAATF
ncbi:winged helix DNA-binding protein [Aquamicrobium lusatiense]|jgi:predicted MarR family transcription regulator|uniref:winged helix DNA-binding protein n=1 Tax=Aquamicrobium TaxID=69278 RepID=UPI00245789B9|nr:MULTISPECIES: winged helix DNA-binding protein [Aquamicrobium]MCK9550114.1 winged helix DNA-binding protein [Aquamicrobium sp.]MDH4989499.1 winged helix DNA-binding protein [Aquamicrobium lusatiense]